MTTRFYYTNPKYAAIMAEDFGVKYQTKDGREIKFRYENCILGGCSFIALRKDEPQCGCNANYYSFEPIDKAYIHTDSLSIFEPKVGDLCSPRTTPIYKRGDSETIMRDGKHFFAPEKKQPEDKRMMDYD